MIARWHAGVRDVRRKNVYFTLYLCNGCLREIEQMGLKVLGKRSTEPVHECNRCDGVRVGA